MITLNESQVMAVTISDITSDSIQQMEGQIDDAENLKDQLAGSLTNVEGILKDLESTKKDLSNYISTLDNQLAEINAKIAELEALIAEKEAEITVTQAALDEAERVEAEQYAAMKSRVKFMYEQGDALYLELFFDARSFSDLLNKAEYIEQISEYDRNMLDEYQTTVDTVQAMKNVLDAEKELLDEAKAVTEEEQIALELLMDQKQQQIHEYEADIENKEQAIAELKAEMAATDELIAQLESSVTEERKAIALAQGYTLEYDGSRFVWPCPSYTRISSDYGMRIHPVLGYEMFHNGVDMAAASGTPILAAYSGVVSAAGYSSAMGNYIMIDHGSGLTTIYMHATKLFVSENDLVMGGEQIATVGTTGRSTGPHLHFSTRLNGVYQSPWNYLQ
jgi:murein DD-endopeptidase MepM/ murein hydrolase activator NlpD